MQVIYAPEKRTKHLTDVYCFLAGGITNCYNWQDEVIAELKKLEEEDAEDYDGPMELIVFNPRRPNFPIDDPDAAEEQIKWEFDNLQACDIFSMYFCGGESDQPICMYELGRNIQLWSGYDDPEQHIAVSVEKGYKRFNDVKIQCKLADENALLWLATENVTPKSHAESIWYCFKSLRQE